VISKRARFHINGESYWHGTRFPRPLDPEELLNEFVRRQIPIQSFYIGEGPEDYFRRVSRMTNGAAEQYNYTARDASSKLTDFIVKTILNKMGGAQFVRQYVLQYGTE